MRYDLISGQNSERLILIFAGWTASPAMFADLHRAGYDIAVVTDYRSLDFDASVLEPYREVDVVAWSLGVVAFAHHAESIGSKLNRCVAVGGTLTPVSDTAGIPEALFRATLNGLNDVTLRKFVRRISANGAQAATLVSQLAEIPIAERVAELEQLVGLHVRPILFDFAYIPADDRIFPPSNQEHAWQHDALCCQILANQPHLPNFQMILDRQLVDKTLVRDRFTAATDTYDATASVQHAISRDMVDVASTVVGQIPHGKVVEVGCGSARLSSMVSGICDMHAIELWDIAKQDVEGFDASQFVQCDAETHIRCVPDGSLAVVMSSSTVQWFNSPRAFIAQVIRKLKPGGLCMIAMMIADNLKEISPYIGGNLNYLTLCQLRASVGEDCELLHCESRDYVERFDNARAALTHLRKTGVNALMPNGLKGALAYMRANGDTPVALTYKVGFIVFEKK